MAYYGGAGYYPPGYGQPAYAPPATGYYERDEIRRLQREMDRLNARARSRSRSRSRSRRRSHSRSSLERELDHKKKELDELREKEHAEHHDKDIILRWKLKEADKKKEEEEMKALFAAEAAARKVKDAELRAKFKAEEEAEKARKEQEYKDFLTLQALKKAEEEEKKKKEKKKIEEGVVETLRKAGYTQHQIDRTLALTEEKTKTTQALVTVAGTTGITSTYGLTARYKIRIKDISTHVLDKYRILWRYENAEHIAILQEVSKEFLQQLYEESKHKKKEKTKIVVERKSRGLALVRHKSRSRSRSRHRHESDDEVQVVVLPKR